MDGISSYHEVTHSKVLVNKRHPHYQNELVFRSVDDRLLELTEEVFFPLSKMAPEPLLERAHKRFFHLLLAPVFWLKRYSRTEYI
jgi:hypothetical protein